jgi:hypothetical protein
MPERPSPDELERAEAEEAQTEEEALNALGATRAKEAAVEAEAALMARAAQMRADYPSLSEADILTALKDARADVEQKNKEALLKRIMADERSRLRREEGMVTGASYLDEMVEITVKLEPWQNPARLNMVEYYDGHHYTLPRHVAATLAEMCEWGQKLRRELKGESREDYYREKQEFVFSGKKGVVHGQTAQMAGVINTSQSLRPN